MQHDNHDNQGMAQQAVIVLGHGSRAADSGKPLEWIAAELSRRVACPVIPAFLQFNEPGLTEACRELADAGARHIFIAPYFLFEGNHMLKDIPEEIGELEQDYPDITFTLAATLGTDENLLRLLRKRLEEAGFFDGAEAKAPAAERHGAARPEQQAESHPIERESFAIIDDLVRPVDSGDPLYQVIRRVIHATGDPSLADGLSFSAGAIDSAVTAMMQSGPIYCDVNMVAAGIEPTAGHAGLKVLCGIAEAATGTVAAAEGITRGAAAFRRNYIDDRGAYDGSIIVVGNAPTALFEVLRLAREEGIRPALVVGVPVGFVGAAESKEELEASGLEYITMPGNRGGSNVAAAIVNALIRIWSGEQIR